MMGSERGSGGGSSSSSRKGKKNGNNNNSSSSSSSEKQPKQPQRGLGVAQLEKIRLTGELGYNNISNNSNHPSNSAYHHHHHHLTPANYPSMLSQEDIRAHTAYSSIPSSSFSYASSPMTSYAYNPNTMMGVGDYDRTSIRYGDSHPSVVPSWNHGNSFYESSHQHSLQPNAAKHLFNLHETTSRSKKHRSTDSIGSSSHNSESGDSQELDLELRLSL